MLDIRKAIWVTITFPDVERGKALKQVEHYKQLGYSLENDDRAYDDLYFYQLMKTMSLKEKP